MARRVSYRSAIKAGWREAELDAQLIFSASVTFALPT